jgi:hypothetical protein
MVNVHGAADGQGSDATALGMSEDEWVSRCASRYTDWFGMSDACALEAARENYREVGEMGLGRSPEAAADEDMGYWTD